MALQYTLRIIKGGMSWAGLPCGSHVWISRATSKRTRSDPIGDRSVPMTRVGNMLSSRYGLIILVCIVRQVYWGCEQPHSSLAMYLPWLEMVCNSNKYLYGMPCGFVQKLFPV